MILLNLVIQVFALTDFNRRQPLAKALKRSDGAKDGRPPFDAVMMFKILVLLALYNLLDDQAEYRCG